MQKKLLMTASSYDHIRSFHLPYLREFQRLGWETHVACPGVPGDVDCIDKAFDLPFQKSMSSPINLRSTGELRKLIRSEQYDLIITHTSLAAFFTRLAVKGMKNRPPLVDVMHGYLFDDNSRFLKRLVYREAERFMIPETDLLLTMNSWDYDLAKRCRLGKRIINISGMGVDYSKLEPAMRMDKIQLRWEHGVPEDAFVLVYAAEFSNRKSQLVLIDAMRELPDNVVLLLCGDGLTREDCIRYAEEKGLSDRILFPGFIDDIGLWYRMADVCASASRFEGMPFNIMEAMYMGLPVVASNVKGHTDLIADGETGLLYPYGNRRACAQKIRQLMQDPALCETLRKNAREKIELYGLKSTLPIVMEQYLSLVADPAIRVVVATHKEYRMPKDPMYLPVQAGRAIHSPLPYTGDDSGPNISEKNATFCELTCLYWAWKNLDAEAVGLCHYRRHFAGKLFGGRWERVLTLKQAEKLLAKAPVILPIKRNYFIETGYSQYVHAHHRNDLTVTEAIIAERCPEYLAAFHETLGNTSGHRFNMLLMRRDLLDRYCVWLFDILFELEKRLDLSGYSDYDRRVFGFVGERMLDVWIEANHIPYVECPVLHMEPQHWLSKGGSFLSRKFYPKNK